MHGFYRLYGKDYSPRNATMQVQLPAAIDEKKYYRSLLDGHYYPEITFPVIFRQGGYGSRLRDFLISDYGYSVTLISSYFKGLLEEHGITGWKSYPAQLFDKKGREIPGYHGFTITGRCGPRDLSQSERIFRNGIAEDYKGIVLNPESWDGSDIFIEEFYWAQVVSPKAAPLFKKQKALYLKPLEEDTTFASTAHDPRTQRSYSGNGPNGGWIPGIDTK